MNLPLVPTGAGHTFSRRRFLTLAGGTVLAGCTGHELVAPATSSTATTAPATTVPATTAPSVVTTIATAPGVVPDDRVLVLVALEGGNDALNTLPPLDDAYRSLRPTLSLTDDELIAASGVDGYALHHALAPLGPLFDAGRVGVLAGIGFPDPDRSHFYSIDRWERADRMDDTLGWLGRWLDSLPADLPALGASALGGTGEMLLGGRRRGTVIDATSAFAFPLSNRAIRSLTEPLDDEPLLAAAQQAFLTSVGAVEEFDPIADAVRADRGSVLDDQGPPAGPYTAGLAVAAEMITADVGARVVTVHGGGFDTHAAQKATHADLLADLATGLAAFWTAIDGAGMADRVLLATHSEFGRRVAQNDSDGCDHGAAGVSFLMGTGVVPGVHGTLGTDELLDGDLRPVLDPRLLFTTCLDWIGGDADAILGGRWDETPLLA